MLRIFYLIFIGVLAIQIGGCISSIKKSELQLLVKEEKFDEIIHVVDDYIKINPNDELGYFAKSIALINKKGNIVTIHKLIDKGYDLTDIKANNYNLQLGFGIYFLRNGYCDEALNVFRPKPFSIDNPKEYNYPLVANGFADCKDIYSNVSKESIKEIYNTIYHNSFYDIDIAVSYLDFLNKNDFDNEMDNVLALYEMNKPPSKVLRRLLAQLRSMVNSGASINNK